MIRGRKYFRCKTCDLLFMHPRHRLSDKQELERYLKHDNDVKDEGYRSFLLRMALPSFEFISKGSKCLDYGCGPNRAMETIFREHGYDMQSYDPYFYPVQLTDHHYDLIICNEVCEHFYHPANEFKKLRMLLKPKGVLVVGTNLITENTDLNGWHYLTDVTHVSFYNRKSFAYIADLHELNVLKTIDDRISIMCDKYM